MMASAEIEHKLPLASYQAQWTRRVTALKEEQAKPEYKYGDYYDSFYESCRGRGQAVIQEIWQKHGGETLTQILNGIQNLNLKTQIELLHIGATDDADYLIGALNSLSLPVEREDNRRNRDNWLQELTYRKLVNHILQQKFPDQDSTEFKAKLPSQGEFVYWEPTSVMRIALNRGPQEMVSIFELIPPGELSLSNFEERLKLELKAREVGCQPVEREFSYRGEVQDVGFRGFCSSIARIWGVTGFARNEYNESVTVVLQGYPEILDAYIQNFQEESKKAWPKQPSATFVGEREIGEGKRITGFHSLYSGETVASIQQKKQHEGEKQGRKTGFWRRLFGKMK